MRRVFDFCAAPHRRLPLLPKPSNGGTLTGAQPRAAPNAPVGKVLTRIVSGKYVAVAKGVVRAAFELDSERVGTVKIGDVVDVLEARETDSGIVRVRFV